MPVRRELLMYRWWEIEDHGGFPPFWEHGLSDDASAPWPSDWDRRPHP